MTKDLGRAKEKDSADGYNPSTKIEFVLNALKHLRDDDPTAKALVFSQWTSLLRIIAKFFERDGIKYVTRTLYGLYTDVTWKLHGLDIPEGVCLSVRMSLYYTLSTTRPLLPLFPHSLPSPSPRTTSSYGHLLSPSFSQITL